MVREYATAVFPQSKPAEEQPPSLFEAIAGAVNITQDRITRSRLAGDPPDVYLSPRVVQIGLLEFYRAAESIQKARREGCAPISIALLYSREQPERGHSQALEETQACLGILTEREHEVMLLVTDHRTER